MFLYATAVTNFILSRFKISDCGCCESLLCSPLLIVSAVSELAWCYSQIWKMSIASIALIGFFLLARLNWWPEHTRFHIIVLESFHKYRLMVSVVCSLVLITLAPNFQKYVIWFQHGHSSTCTINYPSSCFLD